MYHSLILLTTQPYNLSLSGFQLNDGESLENSSLSSDRNERGGAPLKSIDSETGATTPNPDNEVRVDLSIYCLYECLLLCLFVYCSVSLCYNRVNNISYGAVENAQEINDNNCD